MQGDDIDALRGAIAALESQRPNLGDAVLELALAPLRARLAALERPAVLQRRQVTVLFADVVGSTALAQGLDAEDTMAVLSGALQRMADVVQAHQGRVLRFQRGDGRAMGLDRFVVDVLLRGSRPRQGHGRTIDRDGIVAAAGRLPSPHEPQCPPWRAHRQAVNVRAGETRPRSSIRGTVH